MLPSGPMSRMCNGLCPFACARISGSRFCLCFEIVTIMLNCPALRRVVVGIRKSNSEAPEEEIAFLWTSLVSPPAFPVGKEQLLRQIAGGHLAERKTRGHFLSQNGIHDKTAPTVFAAANPV